ncbi:MAG: hypothetical protein K9N49_06955 [Candidatus Marinimicrobia bacterium]|nr:hypothetical protein [Candidatus Neomarinimicrobiota bacterium]
MKAMKSSRAMGRWMGLVAGVLLGVVWSGGVLGQGEDAAALSGLRTWTSQAGTQVEATFVRIQDGLVVLRPQAGPEMRIRPEDLSAEDQQLIAAQLPPPPPAPAEKPAAAVDVQDAFLNPGPQRYDKEHGAVLQTFDFPDYTALATDKGVILIYIKDQGAYRSSPIIARNYVQYVYVDSNERRRDRSRPATGMSAPPQLTANSVLYKQTHTDGVTGTLSATFEPQQIQMGYQLVDPKDIEWPSHRREILISVPGYVRWEIDKMRFVGPRFPEGLNLAELQAHLAECDVLLTSSKGKRSIVAYSEATRGLPSGNREVEIRGPMFTGKRLVFAAPGKVTEIHAWIYADKMPADGFTLRLVKDDPERDALARNEELFIRIIEE